MPYCSRTRQAQLSANDRRELLVLHKKFLVRARIEIAEGGGGNAGSGICFTAEREGATFADGMVRALPEHGFHALIGQAIDELRGFVPAFFAAEEHGCVHDGCVVERPLASAGGPTFDGGSCVAKAVMHATGSEQGVAGSAV